MEAAGFVYRPARDIDKSLDGPDAKAVSIIFIITINL